jgi:uncharacterized membrane protein
MEWTSGRTAACLTCCRLQRQTSTRIYPSSFKKRNQYAYHPANRNTVARHRCHAQDRTMTQLTASIPTLRSSSRAAPRKTNAARQWLAPVGLIALSVIPVLAGAVRLNELMGSPEITANNARFVASPIPVTVHIVSVTLYSLLGALQFVPLLRHGRPSWHRIAGSILVPAGVLVALTGLWMNFFYSRPPGDGESLAVVRLIVGSFMLASIVLAVLAIRRGDFISHGAWMTRAYAIALGAGTQVFTMLPWVVVFGPIGAADELPRTVLMTVGWVINLAVAEYVIRQRPGHRSNRSLTGLGRSRMVHALVA